MTEYIELVIKMYEDDYKRVLEINNCECEWNNMHSCYEAVLKVTPLPKGHGRLIDADWVLNKMDTTDAQPRTQNECYAWDFAKTLFKSSPTIIEADKEEQHENNTD